LFLYFVTQGAKWGHVHCTLLELCANRLWVQILKNWKALKEFKPSRIAAALILALTYDLSTPKTMSFLRYPKVIPSLYMYQVGTLWDHSFLSCALDKQTNSNILLTLIDSAGVVNKSLLLNKSEGDKCRFYSTFVMTGLRMVCLASRVLRWVFAGRCIKPGFHSNAIACVA